MDVATLPKSATIGAAQWQKRGPSVYLEGRAYLDGVDALAVEMDRHWGVDRLRLLVDPELRLRFDRQRAKLNQAMYGGDLDDLKRECERMMLAWRTLDRVARENGAQPLDARVIAELVVDGTAIAIVADTASARAVQADGRARQCWTLGEIARALAAFPEAVRAKQLIPGARVVWAKTPDDPLDELMDDDLPF